MENPADAALPTGHVEDAYYEILAGGARLALFQSLLDLNLPPLLAAEPPTAEQLIAALKLDPARARKWLHALVLSKLLDCEPAADGTDRYRLAPSLRAMFGADGQGGWFYREFLRYFRASAHHPLPVVLHGAKVVQAVPYPPTDHDDMLILHEWMRSTALSTLEVIRRHVDFRPIERLLDVGGGDGTMAIELWRAHPELVITVFNLPGPVGLVREKAVTLGAWLRVSAIAGDFRTDPLPGGNDMVLFSRVLADWPTELCRELLAKADAALLPGGKLVICEPLADENPALTVAWEFSYLPYDDFKLALYKPLALYQRLLADCGFDIVAIHPRDPSTIHTVIVAQKRD
jgi:SAM-dependent methyltransferase